MKKKKNNLFLLLIGFVFVCTFVIILVFRSFIAGRYLALRNHGMVTVVNCVEFEESADHLANPNRGFYDM